MMNTSRLKSFAPAIRIQLLEAAWRKLDYVLSENTPDLHQSTGRVSELRKKSQKTTGKALFISWIIGVQSRNAPMHLKLFKQRER